MGTRFKIVRSKIESSASCERFGVQIHIEEAVEDALPAL